MGRDVEQIVRDLVEIAIAMEKVKKRKEVFAQAQKLAEEKVSRCFGWEKSKS